MIVAPRLLLIGRFMRRELLSGELTLLALALMLAVCAMSSVGFFSERVERALAVRASQLQAADLVLDADRPLPDALKQQARKQGLTVSFSTTFPSMVMGEGGVALANFKAVASGYPLRGEIIARLADGRVLRGAYQPVAGSVWVDSRLLTRLGLKMGQRIAVGNSQLLLAGEVLHDPDAAISLYNFVPRLMLNQADLAQTGLIQSGTRAHWRLLLAGTPAAVSRFSSGLTGHLPAGAHVENIEESRPEIREAMNRARHFLGLCAMLTVALSAAALSLAVRRYLARHWQSVAVLRCMGMTTAELGRLFAVLFILLALLSGILGSVAGFLLQEGLARLAMRGVSLPQPGWLVWGLGIFSALLLLSGLALPPLLAICRVPPLAVLRADVRPGNSGWPGPLLAVVSLLLLAGWQVGDPAMALWLLLGMALFFALSALLAWGLVRALRYLPYGQRGLGWRFALASLARRPWLTVLQVVALSVGLMALLTLTVVRNDLLVAWRHSLPANAPNQFVLNLQPPQRAAFAQAFLQQGLPVPELAPMLRARLVQINDRPVNPADYHNGEARRLAQREFNLSWRSSMPPSNQLLAGRWWSATDSDAFSVERGLADKLGIRLGDRLGFDVAGVRYQGRVSSLRAVSWGSFQVNFFVLAAPKMFSGQEFSLVSSFYLPPEKAAFAAALIRQFPAVTLIDVSEILDELRNVIDRLSQAVEALFVLSLAGGFLVLWSALSASRDERRLEVALLRTLGASQQQVRLVVLSEFAWLGACTGLLAGAGAMALGSLAASKLFALVLLPNAALLPLGMLLGVILVPLAGWPQVRRVLRQPPAAVLRTA
jgi:putative ABC transport system permease protein